MKLRHLEYFLKVAEELSFSRASEKLFISQPPLSRQIKELEEEMKVRLFNRNNKRVELTNAGKYFEHEVKDLFLNLEKTIQQTRKIANNVSGEYKIAYISSTYSEYISGLIEFLSSKYPMARFKLFEVSTSKQILALEQSKIDLGIIRGPIKSPKIQGKLWFRDGYSLVFNNKSFEANTESDLNKLDGSNFVFFNKDYAPDYYQTLMEICAHYGFTPHVTHESNNVNSIIQLVKSGLGLSIVPTSISISNKYPELSYLPLTEINLKSEVLLATQRDFSNIVIDNAIQYLIERSPH